MTDVFFRVFEDSVIALFPYEIADYHGNCESYMKVGQHSSADYHYVMKQSRPATTEEFAELQQELEILGYELKVIKRRNADRTKDVLFK